MIEPPISLQLARRIIDGRAPDQIINRNGDPMFERWWLLRTPSGGDKGNIYLHRWLRDDAEDAHDHPWWNETTVLCGRLVEELYCPHRIKLYGSGRAEPLRRELTPGKQVLREPDAIHRIVEAEPGTITVFVTGRKQRSWGFWVDGEFVPWGDYHGLPAETPADYRAGLSA